MAADGVILDFENSYPEPETLTKQYTDELIQLVPPSWTKHEAKRKGGMFWTIMSSIGFVFASTRELIDAAKLQLRIQTATGSILDKIACDFFGKTEPNALPRFVGESDQDYRARILAEILREKVTPDGIAAAVESLTGAAPQIFEPFNTRVACCWGGTFNGEETPYTFAAWGSTSTAVFQTAAGVAGVGTPNPGIGAAGDTEEKFTFYVTVLNNPKGATQLAIQSVVDRIRAMGIRGIVQGGA